jgi:hypothetical protein
VRVAQWLIGRLPLAEMSMCRLVAAEPARAVMLDIAALFRLHQKEVQGFTQT